jgi:hypothetical protein
LYQQALSEDFARLGGVLREFHSAVPNQAKGELAVERSPSLAGRLIARLTGLPQAAERVVVDLQVTPVPGGERWVRSFNGRPFVTTQRLWRGLLLESGGPFTFGFRLLIEDGGMQFHQQRTWLLGLPVPLLRAPRVSATAMPAGEGWRIDVRMAAPLIGPMIWYHGIMVPAVRLAQDEQPAAAGFRQE